MSSEKPPALKKVLWFFNLSSRVCFFYQFFFLSLLVLFLDSRGSCAIGVLKLNSWGPASPILSLRVRGQLSPPTPLQRLAPKKLLFDIFSIFYSNVDKVLGPETSWNASAWPILGSHPCRRRWNEKWFVVRGASLRNRVPHSQDFCWHLSHWHLTFLIFLILFKVKCQRSHDNKDLKNSKEWVSLIVQTCLAKVPVKNLIGVKGVIVLGRFAASGTVFFV